MARPVTFKSEDIIRAAHDLNRAGGNINGTSLRKFVGSGRPDALMKEYSKLLTEGKITILEKSAGVARGVEVIALPFEMQKALDDALKLLKSTAFQCADIIDGSHLSVDEVQAEFDRLNAKIEQLNSKLTISEKENLEFRIELNNTKRTLDTV